MITSVFLTSFYMEFSHLCLVRNHMQFFGGIVLYVLLDSFILETQFIPNCNPNSKKVCQIFIFQFLSLPIVIYSFLLKHHLFNLMLAEIAELRR